MHQYLSGIFSKILLIRWMAGTWKDEDMTQKEAERRVFDFLSDENDVFAAGIAHTTTPGKSL